jgi:hypothetical protein
MELKTCSSCKVSRATDLFFKNKTRKDGLNPYCKICEKERDKLRYDKKHPIVTNNVEIINDETSKICSTCKILRSIDLFFKSKNQKDSVCSSCKICEKERDK